MVRTEKRPAALSGTKLTMQTALVAEPGKKMNKTRVQLDWARYWTLRRPSKLSVQAPAPTAGTYDGAC